MRVVFDIDGTLSDPAHRLHHILKQPKDWDAFFDACVLDAPKDAAIDVANALWEADRQHHIEFWTGRPERCREATEWWLYKHVGPWASSATLKMRPDGDHRHDNILKAEYVGDDPPDLIFEDRKGVVDAYRAMGLTVFQVAPGDF